MTSYTPTMPRSAWRSLVSPSKDSHSDRETHPSAPVALRITLRTRGFNSPGWGHMINSVFLVGAAR